MIPGAGRPPQSPRRQVSPGPPGGAGCLHQAVDRLLELLLRREPDELLRDLAVLEENHGGDRVMPNFNDTSRFASVSTFPTLAFPS